MSKIIKHDTDGTKGTLSKGELGYDDYTAGGDAGRVYVGDGTVNLAIARKSEVDEVKASIGTDVANRYDKKLELLGIIDITYDVDENPTIIRYTGDDDATVYYRDVITYAGDTPDYISHYYNVGDLVTESGRTEITDNGSGLIIGSVYGGES